MPLGTVRLKIGSVDKELVVFGDRYWRKLLGATEPEPMTTMPIIYENAFGGEDYDKNPVGKGFQSVKSATGETHHPWTNIEYLEQMIMDPKDSPDPAGFGPLDMMWTQRFAKVGTYDKKWLRAGRGYHFCCYCKSPYSYPWFCMDKV